MRQCETRLEQAREQHDELADVLDRHQQQFYETTTRIARLEQDQAHRRSREAQLANDIATARRDLDGRVRELEIAVEKDVFGVRQCETRLEQAREQHDGNFQLADTALLVRLFGPPGYRRPVHGDRPRPALLRHYRPGDDLAADRSAPG